MYANTTTLLTLTDIIIVDDLFKIAFFRFCCLSPSYSVYCHYPTEYSRLRKPWFRNFGNRHSGGWKLFDWLVYHLSGSAVLSSPEPLCGAVAGFTMPQYLIGFHQSINDSAVSFWPDSTDTNAGIFNYIMFYCVINKYITANARCLFFDWQSKKWLRTYVINHFFSLLKCWFKKFLFF